MAHTVDRRIDVRDIDGEPFGDIVAALDDLAEGETLEIVAPFEPVPLYGQLEQRHFDHDTAEEDGVYRVAVRHA